VRQDLAVSLDAGSGDYDPGYGPLISTRLRIATWNLWGRYGPWAERMGPIEASMRAVDADVWALQEVWADDERNQARELASALGYGHIVFDANQRKILMRRKIG